MERLGSLHSAVLSSARRKDMVVDAASSFCPRFRRLPRSNPASAGSSDARAADSWRTMNPRRVRSFPNTRATARRSEILCVTRPSQKFWVANEKEISRGLTVRSRSPPSPCMAIIAA
jgi:hypothetical protein